MTDTIDKIRADQAKYNAEIEKRLAALEKTKAAGRWKPEINDEYFAVTIYGEVGIFNWNNDEGDNFRFSQRNIFKTKAEAERKLAQLKLIAELRDRAGDWVPDWKNWDQEKWYFYFDYDFKKWIWSSFESMNVPSVIYFPAKDDTLIADFGDRLNLLLDQEVKL